MSEDKKEQRKPQPLPGGGDKRGGNFYWIYAILGVLLVVSLFLSNGTGGENNKVITQNYFVKEMLLSNDVERVVVINDNQVEVYLKKEALENNEKYADLKESKGFFDSYHAYFTIANDKQFAEDINDLEEISWKNVLVSPVWHPVHVERLYLYRARFVRTFSL